MSEAHRAQIISVVRWQREERARNPVYRRIRAFMNAVRKRKKPGYSGFIPLAEYEAHLALCRELNQSDENPAQAVDRAILIWSAVKEKYRVPQKPKAAPRSSRKPPLTPEQKRRNLLTHEANLERGRNKAEAKREWQEMVAAWRKKWWPILGRRTARQSYQRRKERIKATKLPNDTALKRQLEIARYGPCICFWCGAKLPEGGQADHIIPLARGGTHRAENICAACPPCNSAKRDLLPAEIKILREGVSIQQSLV